MRLSITILLAGILACTIGYASTIPRPQLGIPFTIHYEQRYDSQDEHSLSAYIVRFERADTTWKSISTYFKTDNSGNVLGTKICYSLNDKGAFCIDGAHQRLVKFGERHHLYHFPTAEQLRGSDQYQGDATILGYETMIERIPDGQGYNELYLCPRLSGVPLKIISESGEGFRTTVEATEVIEGIVDEQEFVVPDYPMETPTMRR